VIPLDREALVRRHNPRLTGWDPRSPLSLGNGDFAFTADFTGLQTCAGDPPGSIPRCTMSQWGFHRYPGAPEDSSALRLTEYACGDRTVGYMTGKEGQEALYRGLRENPHRFHLGRIGLYPGRTTGRNGEDSPPEGMDARDLLKGQVKDIRQELDLWTGGLSSRFRLRGLPVRTEAVCHPDRPLLSFRLESPLLKTGGLGLELAFPYGFHGITGADWNREEAHSSVLQNDGPEAFCIRRTMDDVRYSVHLRFFGGSGTAVRAGGPHRWIFSGSGGVLEFSVLFAFGPEAPSEAPPELPGFAEVAGKAAAFWKAFWEEGAAVSFEGSTDPRAPELERRVILSQYLLAIQSLGSLPPAETGLTCNSWYGKFHLEMHPWHALHGLLWNRSRLVESGLRWYREILPGARKRAKSQGYRGARWPKMTDISGNDSPSPIGCLLCWQQPHLILFAELLYRLNPSAARLSEYADLVFETAVFMADYPRWDRGKGRYILGPPLIPAQENHRPEETLNPLLELEYWRWGLDTAARWKRRLGEPVPEKWLEVLEGLSPCPADPGSPGRYAAHENCSDTYGRYASDHPSLLLAFGFLPPGTADPEMISRSFDAVKENWRMETLWGWDFPAMAMTLARLDRREEAVEMLLSESPKNTFLADGHNRQEGSGDLPLYLPGNGALLLAVAMMAAGWDGSTGDSPGFPREGGWKIRWEGLARYI